MSQELQNKIDELTKANQELTQKVLNHSQGAEALMSQLDAHKGMLNESLTASLNLKAHTLLLEKQHKRLTEIIQGLNKQLDDATHRLAGLDK